MKYLKVLLLIVLSSLLLFVPLQASTIQLPTELIFYNDNYTVLSHPPIYKDHVLYASVRDLSTLFGFTLSFDTTTKEAIVTHAEDTFIFNLHTQQSTFNGIPVFLNTEAFIENQLTFVPLQHFASLFGLDAQINDQLMIINQNGEEQLLLDYLDEPLYAPTYEYTSVHSILINQRMSSDFYTNGTFTSYIYTAYLENAIPIVSFSPYTTVTYPPEYSLIGNPNLINVSPHRLNLPVAMDADYTFLTYTPNTFSTGYTQNMYSLFEDIQTYRLILAQLTVENGIITAIRQIYIP